jgi:hypothetical protein
MRAEGELQPDAATQEAVEDIVVAPGGLVLEERGEAHGMPLHRDGDGSPAPLGHTGPERPKVRVAEILAEAVTGDEVNVNLDSAVDLQLNRNIKVTHAGIIAKYLLGIFAGTYAFIFLTVVILAVRSSSVQEAQQFATIVSTILKELGPFTTSVFAPLLAFVFGYYFGEKGQDDG